MRRLRKDGKCEWKGCQEKAEVIAASRGHYVGTWWERPVGVYCIEHSKKIANEGWPEYGVECPNCGCNFGVN